MTALRQYIIELAEFFFGWAIALAVWKVSGEVLSLIIGAVGTYSALLTLIFRDHERSLTEEMKKIKNEADQMRRELVQSLREREAGYIRSLAHYYEGRHKILENEAIDIMRHYSERFQERMVATSYYDITNWTAVPTEDSFWGVYDKRARDSLKRIVNMRYGAKGNTDEINKLLEENPIITRIFIVERDKWEGYKKIIQLHLGTAGYQVRCIPKDLVVNEGLADESRDGRTESLHDFVMFDNSIVIEIVQVPSEWARSPVCTHGILFLPTLGRRDYWIKQFNDYFERLLRDSFTYEQMDEYFHR